MWHLHIKWNNLQAHLRYYGFRLQRNNKNKGVIQPLFFPFRWKNDPELRRRGTKTYVGAKDALERGISPRCFPFHNHSDIIKSSNAACRQRRWCLGAGVTCTQHYRISRYLTQTCCGVLTLIPGPLESPVCVTLSCLIPVISQPRR